jgi:hypothetical protein
VSDRYRAVHIADIPSAEEPGPSGPDWKPVRIYFDIRSFGTNAYVARKRGDVLVGEHTETDTKHEELFFVARGEARFTIEGEEVAAPAGTFVYIRDPDVNRGAVAEADDTIMLAVGGTPGEAFDVSSWERKWVSRVGASGD